MYPAAEVRWFRQGTVPAAVTEWFRGSKNTPREEQPRVDHYLRHRGGDSLGIKLREGRLEVKLRQTERGTVRLHPRVAGREELWQKWGFELMEEAGPGLRLETGVSHWLAVEKRRALRRYRLEGESVVAVAPAEVSDQGCDLELTRVRVGRQGWWTVGLEAYGAELALEKMLILVADYLMTQAEPPAMAAGDSYGYPRWLMQVENEPDHQPGSRRSPGG